MAFFEQAITVLQTLVIALGKEQFGLPEKEERIATHFIR